MWGPLIWNIIRQEDAGIVEIAVVPTFNSESALSSTSSARPDAFFWRALEIWLENGERYTAYLRYRSRR